MGKFLKFGCLGVIVIVVIIFIAAVIDGSNDSKEKASTNPQQESKKDAPKKEKEEQKKQQDEDKKKEEPKTTVNADKVTYENEIKPTIDAMLNEFDGIWNQEWKPIWDQASAEPDQLDLNGLKETMTIVSSRYDDLSKKNIAFKDTQKIHDPVLKEKLEKFRVDFGLAINYRSNAANAVNQWLKGLASMESRMEESQKSIKLADQKLMNAAASLTEVESKLGVSRN
ncbi:ribonuclease [Bacillus nitratireducens]|uniref:ribonuclease n=1 Tax=Bacillus nitratireducens TaxID=2026193 RepID=UPI003D303AD4